MGWLKDRRDTLREAAGIRKSIYLTIFAGAVGAIDRFADAARWALSRWLDVQPRTENPDMIFGFPSWIIGVTVVFAILFWWTLEFAVRLRNRLKPKFSVSYDNESRSFRKPILLTSDGGKTFERGISIRAQIQCESATAIEQCSVHLTKIEYKPAGGNFSEIPIYEPNKLPWALEEPTEFNPVSVFPRVPKYLGVCLSEETKNSFHFRTNVRSHVAPCELKDVGEYKFYVEVVAQHCASVSRIFLIQWNGKWDEIQACLVENT